MADLDKRIAHLKARVPYEIELDSSTSQDKSEIRQTINTGRETLNRPLDEKNKSLPQGDYISALSDIFLNNFLSFRLEQTFWYFLE